MLAGDDVTLRTLYDGKEFVPFGVRNAKLGHGVIEILAESGPLRFRDFELLVGLAHSTPTILLRTTRGPAHHLRNQILEASRTDAVMCLINSRIRIQNKIAHHPIDEVVDDGRDSLDPAESIIEGGLVGIHRRGSPMLKVNEETC